MSEERPIATIEARFALTCGAIVGPTLLFWILQNLFSGLDNPGRNPLAGVPVLGSLWTAIITAISWVLSLTSHNGREEFPLLMVLALYPILSLVFVLKRWYVSAAAVVIVPLLFWWAVIDQLSGG